MLFEYFASKNQPSGFYISGTLVKNGLNICKLQRKTPVLESVFNKRLQHRCFPVKFGKLLRAPILMICRRLFLYLAKEVGQNFLIQSFLVNKIKRLNTIYETKPNLVYLK